MNTTTRMLETKQAGHVPTLDVPDWTHEEVREELSRILRSRHFVKSVRLSSFLSTSVDYFLAGKADSFKEYTVGTEVYGRSGDYDPTTDTIVRTEARRLRAKLKEYYSEPGSHKRLCINLLAGSYLPVIEATSLRTQHSISAVTRPSSLGIEPGLLSLAVISFHGKGVELESQDLAQDLEEELTHELSQNRDLKVFRMLSDDRVACEDRLGHWTKAGVQFALRGSVRSSVEGPVAQLQLTTIEGMIVWSERFLYHSLPKAADRMANAVCSAFFSSSPLMSQSGMGRQMLQN